MSIRVKLDRFARGDRPRVLDLFAGCGGLSLGFQRAGFEIVAAVENDPLAAESHALNFHRSAPRHAKARDITTTPASVLSDELGLGPVSDAVDVIVGGPPCQAFARIGRAKLREIYEHPEAFLHDPRAQLYLHYLRFVEAFEPLALLMENVPDSLNHGGQNIAEGMCEVLEGMGYVCGYTLLNSVFYGVPQMRGRMFLIAYHRELGASVTFPPATHKFKLPLGYEGSQNVALKLIDSGLLGTAHDYVDPPEVGPYLPDAVTAADAIGDLPVIDARLLKHLGELRRGARRFDVPTMPYDTSRPVLSYARDMKEWPGFEAPSDGLRDHQIRYLPRDYDLFARMEPGSEYPALHRLALRIFEQEAVRQGFRRGTAAWEAEKKKIVPPYDPEKFPNKWWKLKAKEPVRTLMAHLGKDSYSHIHYDDAQARTISVREAARLQSFPDGFFFRGTMNPAFRQIGNAVPPLMAKALAGEMIAALRQSAAIPATPAVAVAAE